MARILVADDDLLGRELLRRLAERLGCEVVEATDGEEAVALFETKGPFDLVLLDLSMPRLDGLGAVGAMRSAERASAAARAPILALSGWDASPAIAAAGFDGFIQKPFDKAAITAAVERWTGVRG